jgi:hypothetical protein
MARIELFPSLGARRILMAVAVCGLSASAPAEAASQRLAWSTFLRAGPGDRYAVIDEIEHSTPVQVLGCATGWCRIQDGRTTGYIDQDALTLARPATGWAPAAAEADCFVAGQVSNRGAAPTRFCGTTPKTP